MILSADLEGADFRWVAAESRDLFEPLCRVCFTRRAQDAPRQVLDAPRHLLDASKTPPRRFQIDLKSNICARLALIA